VYIKREFGLFIILPRDYSATLCSRQPFAKLRSNLTIGAFFCYGMTAGLYVSSNSLTVLDLRKLCSLLCPSFLGERSAVELYLSSNALTALDLRLFQNDFVNELVDTYKDDGSRPIRAAETLYSLS
jgi:hypothetical protein